MSSQWHLAIECSGLGGSVALANHNRQSPPQIRTQCLLPHGRGSVQSLAPTIDQLLRSAQLAASQLDLISVTYGPGSFTGLRVGLATAKMLSWAHKIPLVPVDTLAAIALRLAQSEVASQALNGVPGVRIVAAINAFRQQVFSSAWWMPRLGEIQIVQPGGVRQAGPWQADPWLSTVPTPELSDCELSQSEAAGPVWVTGNALESYSCQSAPPGQLAQGPAWTHVQAPPQLWQPLAEQVAWLGWQRWLTGGALTAEQLEPNYLRASAAEEKRAQSNL